MDLSRDELLAIAFLVNHHRARRLPVPHRVGLLAQRVDHELHCAASGTAEPSPEPQWIGTTEAAQRLGCSERWARKLAPRLGGRQISGRWLIPTDRI